MMYLSGSVTFASKLDLVEVGDLISKTILNGTSFGGLEERIRDEIPAVYTEGSVLGLDFILHGYPEEYVLEVNPKEEILINKDLYTASDVVYVRLDDWLRFLLCGIPGILVKD